MLSASARNRRELCPHHRMKPEGTMPAPQAFCQQAGWFTVNDNRSKLDGG
jgi:hypothetical protein